MSDVTITLHIELPADALEMSRDGDKTTFVIDWAKVPGEIRAGAS